jgi:hypothetical protein
MASTSPKVLLIADNPIGISFLEARFNKWACEVQFALSCKAATAFVSREPFDLVLSQFRLRDGSSYPLAALLIGSNTTLVYSYPVETGCWWLPAVKNGQSCWGSLAMRPSEFIVFLDDILKEIRSRQIASHELHDLVQTDGEIDVSPVEPVNVEVPASTQSALLTVDPSERRRSQRLHHIMPLVIRGDSAEGKTFWEDTFTLSISAHGALVVLAAEVTLGQSLLLMNPQNWDERKVRVARVARVTSFDGRVAQVGIEFEQSGFEFWPVAAPPRKASKFTGNNSGIKRTA